MAAALRGEFEGLGTCVAAWTPWKKLTTAVPRVVAQSLAARLPQIRRVRLSLRARHARLLALRDATTVAATFRHAETRTWLGLVAASALADVQLLARNVRARTDGVAYLPFFSCKDFSGHVANQEAASSLRG